MNWDDLKILLAIHRTGSLSSASISLGIDQSTVSRRIKSCEHALKSKLIERRPDGSVLSESGMKLCVLAENTEAELRFTVDSILETRNELSGPLAITCVDMMVDRFLAPLLAQFQDDYPKIELSVLVGFDAVDLMRGKADVALRVSRRPDENLVGRRLCSFGLGIYGAVQQNGHAVTKGWIDWADGRTVDAFVPEHLASLAVAHRTDSFLSMRAMVRAGLGIAILPCYWADTEPELERIYTDTVSHPDLGLWILYHPDRKQSPRLRAFVDFITPHIVAYRGQFSGSHKSC